MVSRDSTLVSLSNALVVLRPTRAAVQVPSTPPPGGCSIFQPQNLVFSYLFLRGLLSFLEVRVCLSRGEPHCFPALSTLQARAEAVDLLAPMPVSDHPTTTRAPSVLRWRYHVSFRTLFFLKYDCGTFVL